MTDSLDIAFLAIGADKAWRELCDKREQRPSCFDGMGQDGVMQEVIDFAPHLHAAWTALEDQWGGGVWYYDVSEPLGYWIVRQWIENEIRPTREQVIERIDTLIEESQG